MKKLTSMRNPVSSSLRGCVSDTSLNHNWLDSPVPDALAHRNYRRPVQQKLRSRDNDLIPRLDAVLHFVVIADGLPDGQRFLPGHKRATILRLGNECKILT